MLNVSREKVMEAYEKIDRLNTKIAKVRAENEDRVEGMVRVFENVVGGGGIAWINGRYGNAGLPLQVMGFDVDLLGGGALVVGGLLRVAGKQSEHLYNLGSGMLTAWAAREAFGLGSSAAAKAAGVGGATAQMHAASVGVEPASQWQTAGARR